MPDHSQSLANQRSPRARLGSTTPAVLRFSDGHQSRCELKVISLTGRLLSVRRPMQRGTHAKLMFVTESGVVLGTAEMLNAESWVSQPFRFVSLDDADECRLRAAIGLSLGKRSES